MSAAQNIPEGFTLPESSSQLVFQNASNWAKAEAEGVMVVGTYDGLTEKDTYGKENFKFTATSDGISIDKEGNEVPHLSGATIIINTSSNLLSKMRDIELGQEVCVVYNGQNKLTKGPFKGKMAHSFSVLTRK